MRAKSVEVIPAILEKNLAEIQEKVEKVRNLVDWVQIDLADGSWVPTTTFLSPEPFLKIIKNKNPKLLSDRKKWEFLSSNQEDLKKKELQFELHLMVKDPLRFLERFAKVGFKRFYAHLEGDYVKEYLEKARELGVEVGLAIDGPTPLEKIFPFLDEVDAVLVMGVEAGASGRPFLPETLVKIQKLRERDENLPLAVDGGINAQTAPQVIKAGANRLNANSYLFQAEDISQAIKNLQGEKNFS